MPGLSSLESNTSPLFLKLVEVGFLSPVTRNCYRAVVKLRKSLSLQSKPPPPRERKEGSTETVDGSSKPSAGQSHGNNLSTFLYDDECLASLHPPSRAQCVNRIKTQKVFIG